MFGQNFYMLIMHVLIYFLKAKLKNPLCKQCLDFYIFFFFWGGGARGDEEWTGCNYIKK